MTILQIKLLDKLKDQLPSDTLFVEVGTARDSQSTFYLKSLADFSKNDFITIDIDPIYIPVHIKSATMTGEEWAEVELPKMDKRIGLAVMDSHEWIVNPASIRSNTADVEITNMVNEYTLRNKMLNNIHTAVAITKQMTSMMKFLNDKSIVVFPETWINHPTDSISGKGAGAAYLLLAEGYSIISATYKEQYLILGRNIQETLNLPNVNTKVLSKVYDGPKIRPDSIIYKNI